MPSVAYPTLARPAVFVRIRRWLCRRHAWRGMPASTLDLAALREAKLADTACAEPGPFITEEIDVFSPGAAHLLSRHALRECRVVASDDVVGALLAHIDHGFRHAAFPSRPMPAREWWDELARLASAVRQ